MKQVKSIFLILFAIPLIMISCKKEIIEDHSIESRGDCHCSYDFSDSDAADCEVISYIGPSDGFGDTSGDGTGLLIQFDTNILGGNTLNGSGEQEPCDPSVCFEGDVFDGTYLEIYNPRGGQAPKDSEYFELEYDHNEIFIDWDCGDLDELGNLGGVIEFCLLTECPCLQEALESCDLDSNCFRFEVICQ